jgi:HlyD family secretion protein
MATTKKSKKRRKILIFSLIGLVLAGLATSALVRKHEVIFTVQTEKVSRRNLLEKIPANGKIQPVVQVKISPEVSGEIIELPVKEGQPVKKGDLILKIRPDVYLAARNQAEAGYKSSVAAKATAEASLRKAEADYRRSEDLFKHKLMSDSDFDGIRANYEVAQAQLTNSLHQVEMARASLASAEESLAKTTIVSPLTGTVSKLYSEVGERVVGTATMAGTDVMIIADLNEMEARVDIGEMDVIQIARGQRAQLEVDAFRDRKFTGIVTDIANSSKNSGMLGGGSSQEATKFEIRIRIQEKEAFRPGMSVTADIETRSRTNVLTVPIASVTRRSPKKNDHSNGPAGTNIVSAKTNSPAGRSTNAVVATGTNSPTARSTNAVALGGTNSSSTGTNTAADKKSEESAKAIDVVFLMDGERAKMAPVKLGISDDSYYEITEGLDEAQEVVSGGYRTISHDLEDGKKIRKGLVITDQEKKDERATKD